MGMHADEESDGGMVPMKPRTMPSNNGGVDAVSGNALGLRIAAGNVPNLVDTATGGWGKVILDPLNSTQTTTLANLNTLGSLISAFFTVSFLGVDLAA